MLKAAADRGWLDERAAVLEALTCLKRAGSDLILTYYATEASLLLFNCFFCACVLEFGLFIFVVWRGGGGLQSMVWGLAGAGWPGAWWVACSRCAADDGLPL